MTTKITISDLIQSLRKAAANPEAHAPAQRTYFSTLYEDSVLVNCGTACCIAGDLMLKAHEGSTEEELYDIIHQRELTTTIADWVTNELGLSDLEATLAFYANTHYEIHLLLADLLEAGLRLPYSFRVVFSGKSTYTSFDRAFFGYDEESLSLEELKDWMRKNAK